MIPRYQRILFWILIGGIALMAAFLLHGCRLAHKRLTTFNDATPIAAPTTASTQDVTLYLASDADGSITPTTSQVALPQDPGLRARTLIDHLIAQYALPNSAHPLQPGPAIDDVFLLNNQAVINLRGSFLDNHPSGVLVETLTLQSIIGTLHAALPEVTEIRFLVDGEPHDTLAGHADLQRTYPATDTSFKPTPPSEEATQQ
ncbi:MAG TPA: GerMN domain-containing protein [Edaphobacter sp.]